MSGDGGPESLRGSVDIDALLDALPDLVMIHRDGVLLWVNQAFVTALEYDHKHELIGRPFHEIVPTSFHEVLRKRLEAVKRGEAFEMAEAGLRTRRGATLLVEVGMPRVVDFGGAPARLLVGRDVTERVRWQQRLVVADRLAAVGMLAAGVAHEVNNPLAYVLNNIEIAMHGLGPLGPEAERSRAALGVALEGVDRIRAIVRQLLLLTRSDDCAVEPIDVRAVVTSTLALAAGEIARRAQLECVYEDVPMARGTDARLGQVLLNLVVNALEAMKAGTAESNLLRVIVRPGASGQVLVEVIDNGPGIDPHHAPRVFDPFFTTKPQGEGTGLGLSISQRLLTEIGGELSFESALRRTTFRIALPITSTGPENGGAARKAPAVDGGG